MSKMGLFEVVRVIQDVDEKYERRRGASLPVSSIFKNYNTVLRNNF